MKEFRGQSMAEKAHTPKPLPFQKKKGKEAPSHELHQPETVMAFRAIHSHFSKKSGIREVSPFEEQEYSLTPTLEIRQAMSQAKSAYESMRDIQKHLSQAYKEIIKDPS